MRILIDMQACQNGSRFRGIGRYTKGIVTEILKLAKDKHECFLLFNGMLLDNLEEIQIYFSDYLPSSQMHTWYSIAPVEGSDINNKTRKEIAIILRDAYIQKISPDIVFLPTFFEGYDDDSVISTTQFSPQKPYICISTCHDLIPLIQSDVYLDPNPIFKDYYLNLVSDYKHSDYFLAVSESSKNELLTYLEIDSNKIVNTSEGVEEIFKNSQPTEDTLLSILNIDSLDNKKIILYSGASDERKNHLKLIKAFSSLQDKYKQDCLLVFAGGMPDGHISKFKQYASLNGISSDQLLFTGRISDQAMIDLYSACYLFVFPSWHEGFGLPALEAMSCGAPVIAANTTSLPEVLGNADLLFDPFHVTSIAECLEKYIKNSTLRDNAARYCLERSKEFSWQKSAKKALEFFEDIYINNLSLKNPILSDKNATSQERLIKHLQSSELLKQLSNEDKEKLALSIIKNLRAVRKSRRLYVDLSVLVRVDFLTGIQRVVHEIYTQIVKNYSATFDIIPITYSENHSYFEEVTQGTYARPANLRLSKDDFFNFRPDDIFLGLDLDYRVAQMGSFFTTLKSKGCKIYFVVYDILPLKIGNSFFTGNSTHAQYHWLNALTKADGLISISQSVMNDLTYYLNMYNLPKKDQLIKLGWFHLGADFSTISKSSSMEASFSIFADIDFNKPTFIMVGSIEPRKGYLETLEAFNLLWEQGYEGSLVIVASRIWHSDLTVELIRTNSFYNKKLFWFKTTSDEELSFLYTHSTALIAASIDEGFGLPVVEAIHNNLGIICRDIPVFHEVAGEYATYFTNINELVTALSNYQKNSNIAKPSLLTWKDSSDRLMDIILNNAFSIEWQKDPNFNIIPICSERFGTQVGSYLEGADRVTTNHQSGIFLFGGYLSLVKGKNRISLIGKADKEQKITLEIIVIQEGTRISLIKPTILKLEKSVLTTDIPEYLTTYDFNLLTNFDNVELYINVDETNDFYISNIETYNLNKATINNL